MIPQFEQTIVGPHEITLKTEMNIYDCIDYAKQLESKM
jgi:hypothetical protein